MSRHNPPYPEMGGSQQSKEEPVEFERSDQKQPQLRWVVVESPDQSFLLKEDDYVLDSHFNAQYDSWEVLIRLESDEEED